MLRNEFCTPFLFHYVFLYPNSLLIRENYVYLQIKGERTSPERDR